MSRPRTGWRVLKLLALVSAACLPLPAAGCATCVKHLCHDIAPSSTFVALETTPPGAVAKLSNGRTVTTPARLVLRSDQKVTVTFTKDGYQPAEAWISPSVSYWFLGDLITLPPFGFLVDLEQGGVQRLYPSGVHVDLESVATAEPETEAMTEPAAEGLPELKAETN